MSKIAVICSNSLIIQNLQKCGILSVLPNNFLSTTKLNYHTCNNTRKNIIAHKGSASVRFSSSGIVKSTFPSVNVPKENVVEFVWKDVAKREDETAATCAASGRTYSYGMMYLLINKFAQALLSHCGLKQGDVVGLLLPNIPEYIIISHGIMAAGLTVTSVNPLYKPDEVKRQFQNAGVKAIVTIQLFLDVAVGIAPEIPGYKTTICAGGEDDSSKNVNGLQTLLMAGHTAELPKVSPTDLAFLPYSSGTTGLPKGVMLTHSNLVSNLTQLHIQQLSALEPHEVKEVALTVLPLFHIYGFNAIMNSCLRMGINLITLPKFTPEDYIKALIEHRPYFLFVVPSLLLFLASHPAVTKDHLASVQSITSGAAPATEGLIQKFQEKIGREVSIRQGYGMTESSPVALFTPRNAPSSKKDTAGILVPNTEGKVVSLSTGEALGPNKPGELLVRGPQIMQGYLNNKEATTETITKDGWLRTGDVVYYDEDGYFYIVDRCKELIKVKGNQVSPTELENIILEIPGVADVAVVGIPDTLAGELPRAFIVKKKDAKVSEEDVISHVHPKVASYKKIGGGIKFIETIPRNPSGKILRNELKIIQC